MRDETIFIQTKHRRCRQFACPFERYDQSFAEAIATSYASALIQLFLDRYGKEIGWRSTGLVDFLADWRASDLTFDTVWEHSFGQMDRSLGSHPKCDIASIATRVGLQLASESNKPAAWCSLVDSDVRLRWADWLLPLTRSVRLASDGRTANFSLGAEHNRRDELIFRRRRGRWSKADSVPLASVGQNSRITLVPKSGVSEANLGLSAGASPLVEIGPREVEAFDGALRLLANWSPSYSAWVERILRSIVCFPHYENQSFSGSWHDAPGVIHMTMSIDSLKLAEVLVHESSHQYFHLLTRLGPVDDGSDTNEYYSPPVGRKRPLSRILIAYHAFANIVLFYRDYRLRGGGRVESHINNNLTKIELQIEELAKPLDKNSALTPIGTALYEPLAARLA